MRGFGAAAAHPSPSPRAQSGRRQSRRGFHHATAALLLLAFALPAGLAPGTAQAQTPTFTLTNTLSESFANDGSVVGSAIVTISGGTFVALICDTNGDGVYDSTTGDRTQCLAGVGPVPAGLTGTVTRTSDTEIAVTFAGQATSHTSPFTSMAVQLLGAIWGAGDGSYTTNPPINFFASPPTDAPTAAAGADQTVAPGDTVTLDGACTDPNTAIGDAVTPSWTQTSGTDVTLSDASALQPTFTAPTAPGPLVFRLGCTDSHPTSPQTHNDDVTVTVAAATGPAGLAFTSPSPPAFSLKEHDRFVGRVRVRDQVANRPFDPCRRRGESFRLGGADGARFVIWCSGALWFRAKPDFESPRDEGGNNVYDIEVTAKSGSGADARTATQVLEVEVTNVDPPGVPEGAQVTVASRRTLRVHWAPPTSDGRDAVTRYEHRYTPPGPGLQGRGSTAERYSVLPYRLNANNRNRERFASFLSRLVPDTAYTVWVRAVNREGAGPWTEAMQAMTSVDVPAAPAPVVEALSQTRLRVSWAKPAEGRSPITGYRLVWRPWSADRGGLYDVVEVTAGADGAVPRDVTLTGLSPASRYQVKVRAVNARGESPWSVLVTGSTAGAGPARVAAVPEVSAPASGGAYRRGEPIEARVRFTEPVTVEWTGGEPTLGLALGGSRREAAWVSGSGTDTLVFGLTVPPGDAGAGAAKAVANGLRLGSATIRGVDGTDAVLAYGAAPGVTAVEIAAPGDGAWDAGDAVQVTVTFAEPVTVDTTGGTPSVGLDLSGAGARRADYASGSGTDRLAFAYTLAAGDGTVSAVTVAANALALNNGRIVSTGGLDAALAHGGAEHAAGTGTGPAPLTGSLSGAPAAHDGNHAFTVTLTFSEAPAGLSYKTVRDALFTVTGGRVTGARRARPPSNLSFEMTLAPDGDGPVTLALATLPACGAPRAVCTADGRALTGPLALTVPGPAGAQPAARGLAPLTGSFSGTPPEHDGNNAFTVTLAFSEAPAGLSYRTVRDALFTVTGGRVTGARRASPPSNLRFEMTLAPAGNAPVTLALATLPACGASGSVCTADGRALGGPLALTVPGPATLSVADASVEEGPGAALAFAVTLDRARHAAVTVDYATSDGTATAGEDYTAASGTLTFKAGETAKTVEVAVLDDAHDEGTETMTLALSNAAGARIADGVATGSISNSDPAQRAWNARFGRTVADQVLDAVDARMQAARAAGSELTLGGQRVALDAAASAEEAEDTAAARSLAAWLGGAQERQERRRREFETQDMSQRDLLLGTSFSLTGGSDARSGHYALWGRGAVSRFDGREGALTLDGEVASAFLGADWSRERTTLGLIAGHSLGDGGYSSEAGSGTVSSTLTGLYPWVRHALNDRVSAWGVAGYGEGTLTMTPANPDGSAQAALRTDLDLLMGAVGLRGTLVEAPETGGVELAVTTDATGVRTRSAAVTGAGGNLAGATAEVTRLRLGLEGARAFRFEGGAALTPSLEVGVRQDGGDAETGFGVEAGGGIAWSDPARGLSMDLKARGLVSHDSSGFREAGLSGTLSWDGRPGNARGPSLTLSQSVGAPADGGMDGLFEGNTLAGLAAADNAAEDGPLAAHRFEATFGYGLPAFGDRFTMTPEAGFGLSDTGRDYRLGWRLNPSGGDRSSFELGLEATRSEPAHDGSAGGTPEHGIGLRMTARW